MRAVRAYALACALVLAVAAAGCGSDDSSSTAATEPAGTSSSGGGDAIASAQKAAGDEKAPWTEAKTKMPTDGPKGATGKTLVAVTCGIQIEGCRAISQAHVEAAKALGWKTRLIDGKGAAAGWSAGIQSALQLKPDVLALGAILPSAVGDLLAKAHAAGVKVICTTCGATTGKDNVDFANGDDGIAIPVGRDSANYALAQSGKKTKALVMYYPEFGTSIIRRDAFLKEFKAKCPSCSTKAIAVKISEWGTSLPGRVQSILQQDSSINWIFSPADETAVDASNAIKAAGLTGKVHVVGGNGEKQSFQRVSSDESYAAVVATSYFIAGWEGVDAANRLVQDQEPAPLIVQPNRLMDKSNVSTVKPNQYWSTDFDFRAAYKKLWGM